MHTYAERVFVDVATGRPLAGRRATVVDAETEAPVQAYRNGEPVTLVSGAHGVVDEFQTESTTRRVRVSIDSRSLSSWCLELPDGALAAADRAEAAAAEAASEADRAEGGLWAEGMAPTAWAQTTPDGHRLPLGYSTDGRLDDHAVRSWIASTDDAEIASDPLYRMVRQTPDGQIIYAERWDGGVEIPGLVVPEGAIPAPPSVPAPPPVMDTDQYTPGSIVRPARADYSQVVLWGSSTMEYAARDYGATWSEMMGVTLHARGKASEWIEQTAARQGAVPAVLTPAGGTIPASGGVEVTAPSDSHLMQNASVLRPYAGTLAGVHGTLAPSSGKLVFTRTSAGTAVPVAEVPFLPDDEALANAVTVIQAGKNNLWAQPAAVHDPAHVMEYRWKMLRHHPAAAAAVLHVGDFINRGTAGTAFASRVVEVNALARAEFGPAFVDVPEWLASGQAWEDSGVTPTDQDRADAAAGVLPAILAADNAHYNAAGAKGILTLIGRHMTRNGWTRKDT